MKKLFFILIILFTSCGHLPISSINLSQKADMIIESAEQNPPDTSTIVRTADTLYDDDAYVHQLEQRVRQYELDSAKDLSILFKYFIGTSAILLIGGVFMFTYNQPLVGTGLIGSAISLTAYTTLLQEYQWLVAIVTVVICIILMCVLAYKYYYSDIALKDTINTVEVLKDSGAPWSDNRPLVNKLQHPRTKKIIGIIKDREVRL